MAEIRTEEQREEIAQECARIEKAGGDVLGYLHGLNYISARATWIRLQKEFLGRRKEWQLTDGKPKKKKEATMVARPGRGKYEKHLFSLLDGMDAGEDRDKILQGLGYEDPRKAYQNLRLYARQRHPEVMDRFPDLLKRKAEAQRKPGKTKEEKEVKETMKTEEVTIEQTAEPAALVPEDGIQEEQVPAVSVITKPMGYDGFTVRAVEGDFGSYRFQEINGKQWIDYDDKELANQLSMTVDQWRGFLEEIRKAAQVLGVEL
jgi:hypothetical protein